jgi:hypothetical protein
VQTTSTELLQAWGHAAITVQPFQVVGPTWREQRCCRDQLIGRNKSNSWLQVLGTTERPQIDQRVGHQFHAVMVRLFELEAQQQPLELVLPREGPLHA